MDPHDQHRMIATLQKRWGSDAFRDMRYNLNRAAVERAHGNFVLARGYEMEARWDRFWGNRRLGIANREIRKIR